MATVMAIDLKCRDITAINRQLYNRFISMVVCAAAVSMLCFQQAIAADSDPEFAPILNSDTTNSDTTNSDTTNSDNSNAAAKQAGNKKWAFTPSLGLGETYTDNLALAAAGSEKSAWVTQVIPSLSLAGAGPNLKGNVNYQMQNLFYSDSSIGKTTYNQLNADASAKVIGNFFFVDGMATINQQNVSPLGTLAVDNINITNNRTNVRTYSIAPYLKHSFSNGASGELRYTHGGVDTDSTSLPNSQADNILLNLNSNAAAKTLGWGINYNKQHMDYTGSDQTSGATESQSLSGTLRSLVTPSLSLNATGGYEKYNYLSLGEKSQGASLTAGFSWNPSERTEIEAAAGHKFFGPTYLLKASYRAHRTAWNVDYSEDITSAQSQFLMPATDNTGAFLDNLWASSIPDPGQLQQTVDTFITSNGLPSSLAEPTNYLSNEIFLQKLMQASFAITGKSSTLIFTLFGMTRTALASETGGSTGLGANVLGLNFDQRQIGGTALWSWQLSSRTSGNLSAGASGTGGGNYLKTLQAGVSRQFQPTFSGSVVFRRVQQDSDQIGVSYKENAITGSLMKKF